MIFLEVNLQIYLVDRNKNRNGNIDEGYKPQPTRGERGYTPRPGEINNSYQPTKGSNTERETAPEPAENEEV